MNTTQTSYMTSGDIQRVLGLTRKTLNEWKRRGVLRPTSGGDGMGDWGQYSLRDVLGIAIGLRVRSHGFSVAQCGNIVNAILARSLESLKTDWTSGRRLLVAIGDRILPALLTREQVFNNPWLDLPAIYALGMPVCIVDLCEAHRLLVAKIAETQVTADDNHNDNQHDNHTDWPISQSAEPRLSSIATMSG